MKQFQQHGIAFYTIFRKEIMRFMRIWIQTILPSAITTALYLLIFGTLIGERIGEMDGIPYMDYIIPGIVMMSIITNAYSNTVSSFYSAKFQRHIEELLVAPTPNWIILAGYVSGGVARGIIVGFAVMLVASVFTELRIEHFAITLLVVILTAVLFALGGFINAVFAKTFDDISIIPTFVLTPLTYLGGVFYSITLLPSFWQQVSLANPILYIVNIFRYGMLGISDIDILQGFLVILAFVVMLTLVSLFLLHKGVGIKS